MNAPVNLLTMPPEIILNIYSYLDLPDLATLSQLSPFLACLASDPALHRMRILVVAPSRVAHSLFGQSQQGLSLRPTVGDLVQRGVMRGLGIERRWRMGIYFHSPNSVKLYENCVRLQRGQTSIVVSSHLRRRPNTLKTLHQSQVFPDVESSSLSISRSLLPVMHKLKWSLQKDQFARIVRDGACTGTRQARTGVVSFGTWIESKGNGIVPDGDRVRLAICPGVRKYVKFYEDLDSRKP